MLGERGRYADARRSLEEALAMRRRLQPEGDAETGVAAGRTRARVPGPAPRRPRRSRCIARRLAVRRRLLGDRHRETAVSENNLASVLRLRGDLDGAAALLRHALDVSIETRGPRHPNAATTRHDLALIAYARGDYASAEAELRDGAGTAARDGRSGPSDRRPHAELARARAGRPRAASRGAGHAATPQSASRARRWARRTNSWRSSR